jgi:hypothetical protein
MLEIMTSIKFSSILVQPTLLASSASKTDLLFVHPGRSNTVLI